MRPNRLCLRFEDIPGPGLSALAEAENSSPFFGRDWFELFSSYLLEEGESPLIYYSQPDRGGGCGLLPARLLETGGLWPRRELRSLVNYYSPGFRPVVSVPAEGGGRIVEALIQAVTRRSPKFDVVNLYPLEAGESTTGLLADALRHQGWRVQRYFCFGNWYLDCRGRAFDSYFADRPSKIRNTLKRKRRKFDREAGAKIEIITSHEGFEEALAAYHDIYEKSWKVSEPYPDFISGLAALSRRKGWLRMGVLSLRGQPVAAQFWIVANGVAYIYKLAQDPAFDTLSPGSLLTMELMRHVMDIDKVREVDYLMGDEPYKQHWMEGRREFIGIAAFNPKTLRGVMEAARNIGGRALKRMLFESRK